MTIIVNKVSSICAANKIRVSFKRRIISFTWARQPCSIFTSSSVGIFFFSKYRRALLVWFLNKILNFKRGFVVIEKLALIIGFSYGFDSLQERKFKKAKISFF